MLFGTLLVYAVFILLFIALIIYIAKSIYDLRRKP